MKNLLVVLGSALLLSLSVAQVAAAPNCLAKFRADTPAVDNPAGVAHKGATYGPITQLRINPKTGAASYCAHGDSCYPAGGLTLTRPCSFSSAPDSEMRQLDPNGDWLYSAE